MRNYRKPIEVLSCLFLFVLVIATSSSQADQIIINKPLEKTVTVINSPTGSGQTFNYYAVGSDAVCESCQQVADEFDITVQATITEISWFGDFSFPSVIAPGFDILIYSDQSGLPSNTPLFAASINNLTGVPTGLQTYLNSPYIIYSFSTPLSTPIQLSPGKYWICIRCNNDSFAWQCSYPDETDFPVIRHGNTGSWYFVTNSTQYIVNQAFTLSGIYTAETTQIKIDIRPWSKKNPINYKGHGILPVAIFSTEDFDAPSQIDRNSLTFGATGNENSLAFCNRKPKDLNRDGSKDDLVCHFYIDKAGFKCGETEGILKGKTMVGTSIEGKDLVRIINCK
jgi:hypothetical protein